MEVILKKYSDLTSEEKFKILNLIISGGEVSSDTLPEQLTKAEIISFIKDGENIVATATIKKPRDSYKTKVFTKSCSGISNTIYQYELGYVMVEQDFRKYKLATRLCALLCEKYSNQNLFATTRIDNWGMLSILKKNLFKEVGNQYLNKDKTAFLKLFVNK